MNLEDRKLGVLETLYAITHDELEGHNTICVVSKIKGILDGTLYHECLKFLFDRHPMLRATINLKKDGYYFSFNADFSDIPITIFEQDNDENWKDIYENELNIPLNTRKHCWRSILLISKKTNSASLYLTCCHAAADGLSLAVLVKEFLAYINNFQVENLMNFESSSMPASIETLISQNEAFTVQKNTDIIQWNENPHWPYAVEDVGINCRVTKNVFREINEVALKKLISKARQSNLTLNDLLCAFYLKTIKIFSENKVSDILMFVPANLRSIVKSESATFQVFSAAVPLLTYYDLHVESSLDDCAENCKTQLRAKMENLKDNFCFHSQSDVDNFVKYCKTNRDSFFLGFGISNLGRFNFGVNETDTFQLESFLFSSSRRGADCALILGVVSVGEKMFLIFNFVEPLLNSKWVDKFADTLTKQVAEYIQ